MINREPMLFRDWHAYNTQRQIMAAAIVLKSSGWQSWSLGHAKLLSVLLWDYECRKVNHFKYCHTLKKNAYRRTHNYRLLNGLSRNGVLIKQGTGCYRLSPDGIKAADKAIAFITQADHICNEALKTKRCNLNFVGESIL